MTNESTRERILDDHRCDDELAGHLCQRLPGHDGDHKWADAITHLTWSPIEATTAEESR